MKRRKYYLSLLLGSFSALVIALACGPSLPLSYLSSNGDATWPYIDLAFSLLDLAEKMDLVPAEPLPDFPQTTLGTDCAAQLDFAERLAEPGVASGLSRQGKALLLQDFLEGRAATLAPPFLLPGLPDAMEEFRLYEEGCRALFFGTEAFPEAWTCLLELPAAERRYRTTWVHYMQGTLHAKAGRWDASAASYRALRRAAREGALDRLGLAHDSLRREFRDHLQHSLAEGLAVAPKILTLAFRSGHHDLYRHILREITFAVNVLSPRKEILEIARHPVAREVLIRLEAGGVGPDEEIFALLVSHLPPQPLVSADMMAFVHHRRGESAEAARWLKFARDESPTANWVRAETHRRAGRYAEAARWYRACLELAERQDQGRELTPAESGNLEFQPYYASFSRDEARSVLPRGVDGDAEAVTSARSDVRARRGAMLVHGRAFLEALDCFLLAGAWIDAAYVAEHLLPVADLVRYVDARFRPDVREAFALVQALKEDGGVPDPTSWSDPSLPEERRWLEDITPRQRLLNGQVALRCVLGRRLVREGRVEDALPYLPADLHPLARRLAQDLSVAEDAKSARETRALAMFDAARILRWHGLELSGTEGLPDSAHTRGAYFYGAVLHPAYAPGLARPKFGPEPLDSYGRSFGVLKDFPASEKPVFRSALLRENPPTQRFHYRLRAIHWLLRCAETTADHRLRATAWYAAHRHLRDEYAGVGEPWIHKIQALPRTNDLVREVWKSGRLTSPMHPEFARLLKSAEGRLDSLDDFPPFIAPPPPPPPAPAAP